MNPQRTLPLTRPVSVWNKPLNADFKALFKALSKAALHGGTGSWTDAAADVNDALTAVGFDDDPGQVAWLLIRRALTRAMFDLVEEAADRFRPGEHDLETLCDELDLSLEEAELTIDAGFFERPKELPLLTLMAAPFEQWLIGAGLTAAAAADVAARLGSYFVFRLAGEWSESPKRFEPVRQAFDTPFARAQETERAWLQYAAWLERQVDEPFSLRQVYVPLRAYWEERLRGGGARSEPRGLGDRGEEVRRTVVDLEKELTAWLERADRDDAIRVLSGGPGSGKSSFAKMFAASMVRRPNLGVLYVPLHHFDPSSELTEALQEFAAADPFLPEKPLDPKSRGERLLILFDGLDELALQGKIAQEIAQKFVREVVRSVESFNRDGTRLQVILGGRELVIQATRDEFRRHQVLHLLAYVVPESEREGYEDQESLLSDDSRNRWWQRYGQLSGRDYTGLPKELAGERLLEVTGQPLLNYLFALSYDRGKVDFREETSLNVVYRDLLAAVYERGWERHGHRAIQGISEDHFLRILEEIALAAWHGDGRTTTVREIEVHCAGTGLKTILDSFQEGAKAGVTRLLTAFYFRQQGYRRSGDKTFEFTHKSFGEYLTARRIVGTLETMALQRGRRRESPDDGWDERDALKAWAEVCGPTTMELYLFSFLRDEIRLSGKAACRAWQLLIQGLFGFLLRSGMPMERLEPPLTFHQQTRQARNAEEALMAGLSACAKMTQDLSEIAWPSLSGFGTWLKRIQAQREGPVPLAMSCLSLLKVSGQVLAFSDLYGAILDGASLRGADFNRAILGETNLREANLERAILYGANLNHANLSHANLSHANLSGSSLNGADLSGSNLRGSNLDGASLNGAILVEANLERADLDGANLFEADLAAADLKGASIQQADLSGANLFKARLERADLYRANLQNASLRKASLDRVNLHGARLARAILHQANLAGVENLTQRQLNSARGDDTTRLPRGLSRPRHWNGGIDSSLPTGPTAGSRE